MTTCNRCGKPVGTNDWDIHTCTPKPGLCDDCETVSHCLKHGCIPKHQALEQMAQNARELGLDYSERRNQMKTVVEMAREAEIGDSHGHMIRNELPNLERFAALVRADEREACAKVCDDWPNGRDDVYSIGVAIRARGETK